MLTMRSMYLDQVLNLAQVMTHVNSSQVENYEIINNIKYYIQY